MKVVGLDGYRNGWVAITIQDTHRTIEFLKSVRQLNEKSFDLAMIDIPIGLPDFGHRNCDLESKNLLGAGSPRVFTGARRDYWNFESQADANKHYRNTGDKGISCQLWCLRQKIQEVDEFITPGAQETLRETHPELAFWRLNGSRLLPSKKTREGIHGRLKLLRENGIPEVDEWVSRTRLGTGAKADDVLDACAAALVALKPNDSIPHEPRYDSKGLRMQIWY